VATEILPKIRNIIRIFIRVLPFVFEDTTTRWQTILFEKIIDEKPSRTFGDKLVDAVIGCLFLPGFTLPDKRKDGTFAIIWETGVGAPTAPPSTPEIDVHRTEVLKLLLVLTSQTLYEDTASSFRTQGVFFTELLLSRVSKTSSMALLCSLINVVMQYDPIGVGLPYNYVLFADTRDALANVALQLLLVLLDYRYPFEPPAVSSPQGATATPTQVSSSQSSSQLAQSPTTTASAATAERTPAQQQQQQQQQQSSDPGVTENKNRFQDYLSKIHRVEDFNVIVVGLHRLLNNPITSSSTYLPGSTKTISFSQELVIFTWKLLELNKRFVAFLVQDALLLDILCPVLYYALEARQNEGKHGLIHVTCFLLLLLSGERNFGVRLNKQYDQRYPQLRLPVFDGNYADLIILTFHRLITDGDRARLFSLFDCMLTIVANISPYIKSLSSVTCHRLLSLFRSFTSPRFLLAGPTNHRLCSLLLDVFNNIIQYQFDGNVRLVYAILRQRELFERLGEFDLEQDTSQAGDLDDPVFPDGADPRPEKQPQQQVGTDSTSPASPPGLSTTAAATATPATATTDFVKEVVSMVKGAESQVKPQGFVPTEEWIRSWKSALTLATILRLLNILLPQIEKICVDRGIVSEDEVLKFLSSGTLVGLLPVPHPIMVRKYKSNPATYAWATVYMWGVIYVRNLNPPIWFGTKIALFVVKKI